MSKIKFGRYNVEITNPDKIYFPDSKITKGEFVDYYKNIADVMIPHIKNRPVSMLRFPNGIKGISFFQKDASDYFPKWIKTKKIKKKDGTVNHVICNNAATLVYLANQACITPHVWLSKIDKLEYPNRLIFDLDPSGKNDIESVKSAAIILKNFFVDELKLNTFIMTTGSRGYHITIPLDRKENFDSVRAFAQDAAKTLAERHPEKLTAEVRKNKRKGRIFLDTARNAYAQTAVPPYSIRPKKGAPIASPLYWDELLNKELTPQSYNIKNIFTRIKNNCPWKDIDKQKNSLKKSKKILAEILEELNIKKK